MVKIHSLQDLKQVRTQLAEQARLAAQAEAQRREVQRRVHLEQRDPGQLDARAVAVELVLDAAVGVALHLRASAGVSRTPGVDWGRTNGTFHRVPLDGVLKLSHMATTGESIRVQRLAEDHRWLRDPAWAHTEGLVGFAGHPLVFRGEVLGVLAVFLRTEADEACLSWLRVMADVAAVAIANAQAFEAVDARFQQLFPRLFNGGRAQLKLTDPSDLLATGVEIEAQPPGKQLRSLDLLSGGEKALTAVSLIFAIFLIKPSPFCILDEVDAPLDDANVGRMCKLVRELSGGTQFIVITHNKVTMEASDRLYGVTMEQRGISKLVSVNMRRAIELAYN